MGPRPMGFGGDFWRELNIKMQLKEIWEGVEWINPYPANVENLVSF